MESRMVAFYAATQYIHASRGVSVIPGSIDDLFYAAIAVLIAVAGVLLGVWILRKTGISE